MSTTVDDKADKSTVNSLSSTVSNLSTKVNTNTTNITDVTQRVSAIEDIAVPTIISGSGTKSLPSSPTKGQVVYVKGTTGHLTINGTSTHPIMHHDDHDTQQSRELGEASCIFVFFDPYWVEFRCG